MKVYSILNLKGGVGKTQSCINIAQELSYDHKVLLIDLDPQGNASIQLDGKIDNVMYDFFINQKPLQEIVQKTKFGFDLIVSELNSNLIQDRTGGVFQREFMLRKGFEKLSGYDYVIIDCPPSFDILTKNACLASDMIYVPVGSEPHSASGLFTLGQALETIGCEIDAIFFTMYDQRTNVHKWVLDETRECYGELVAETIIPRATVVNESVLVRKTLNAYKPNTPVSNRYKELVDELFVPSGVVI